MSRILLIATVALTVLFLALGALSTGGSGNTTPKTPDGAVRALLTNVQSRNWHAAYSFVANTDVTDLNSFKASFGSIGKNDCGGCHEKYRIKKS